MAVIQAPPYMIDHSIQLIPKLLDSGPLGNEVKSELLIEPHQAGDLTIAIETFEADGQEEAILVYTH